MKNVKSHGDKAIGKFLYRILRGLYRGLLRIFAYPLYCLRLRFLMIPDRFIGHLASEPDLWIKEGILGMRPRYLEFFLAPMNRVANRHLLNYWRPHLRVISSPVLCRLLEPLAWHGGLKIDPYRYARNLDSSGQTIHRSSAPAIIKGWGDRQPLLALSDNDRKRGWECLRKLGVPPNAWFICVQNREAAYYKRFSKWTKSSEEGQYDLGFRDNEIDNYFLAMQAIVDRGGWCIRIGDPETKPVPNIDGVLDYAHLDLKSEWMDVFLCASCRFFLGNTSGLFWVSAIFGVPSARANIVPMSTLSAQRSLDVAIPKLIWSRTKRRYLTFKEVLDSSLGDFVVSEPFRKAGVDVVENSAEDIRDFALEMLDIVEGAAVYSGEDERLQHRMQSLFRPSHFAYGGTCRIGRDFLRKYAALIGDDEATAEKIELNK